MAQVTYVSGTSGTGESAPVSPAVTETANQAHQVVRDVQPILTISGGRGRPTIAEYRLPDGTVTDRAGVPITKEPPATPQPTASSLESAGRMALNILQKAHEASQQSQSPEIGRSKAEEQRVNESRRQNIAAETQEQQTEQPGFFARTYGAVTGAISAPIQTVRNWWNGENNNGEPTIEEMYNSLSDNDKDIIRRTYGDSKAFQSLQANNDIRYLYNR